MLRVVVKALKISYEHLPRRYFLSLIIVEAAFVHGNRSQGQDSNDDESTEASTSGSKDPSSNEDDMMNSLGLKAVEAATSAVIVFGPGMDMSDSSAMASFNPVSVLDVLCIFIKQLRRLNPDIMDRWQAFCSRECETGLVFYTCEGDA